MKVEESSTEILKEKEEDIRYRAEREELLKVQRMLEQLADKYENDSREFEWSEPMTSLEQLLAAEETRAASEEEREIADKRSAKIPQYRDEDDIENSPVLAKNRGDWPVPTTSPTLPDKPWYASGGDLVVKLPTVEPKDVKSKRDTTHPHVAESSNYSGDEDPTGSGRRTSPVEELPRSVEERERE